MYMIYIYYNFGVGELFNIQSVRKLSAK